jgi:acetolactate synthase small subunit
MVSSIYTADVKLNATDKNYHKYVIIQNENGVLMINKGLFSISFMNEEAVLLADVEVKNKKHIGDITL